MKLLEFKNILINFRKSLKFRAGNLLMNIYFEIISKVLVKAIALLLLVFFVLTGINLFAGSTTGQDYADLQSFFAALFYLAVYLAAIFFALDHADDKSLRYRAGVYLLLLTALPTAIEKLSVLY